MKTKYITAGTGKYAPKLYALSLNKVGRKFWRVEIASCDIDGKMVEIPKIKTFTSWIKAIKYRYDEYEKLDRLVNQKPFDFYKKM